MSCLGVLADHHWFVSHSVTTTYLYWLCQSPSLDKEDYFVCFFVVALLPAMMWVLSLSLSLMVCTLWFQLILISFGRYVISVGHFPQKSLSRNPRIGFPLSLLPDHTLLPLTCDPPLPVLVGYRLVMFRPCACSTFVYVQNLPAAFAVVWRLMCTFTAHLWLLMAWAIFWFLILYGLLPLKAGLWLIVGSYSFSLLSYSFRSLATISYCTILLFLLWCYLTPACWASLGLLLILLSMTQYDHLGFVLHCLWALLSHLFPLGHPWPTSFPWASLTVFLTLRSHGLLLTLLGFPDPITLSFILGAHGLAINPFLCLHYFGPAVAHSHFSTSHIVHGFATSLSSDSFRLVCFLKTHLFILWAHDPLFLLCELNGFSIHLLTLFYPCYWASSFYWASQNEYQQIDKFFFFNLYVHMDLTWHF